MRKRVTEKDMGTRGRADAGQRGRGERRRADTGTRGQRELQEQGRGTNAPRNYFPSAPGHLCTEHLLTPHFLTSLTPHSSLTEAIDEVDSQADKVGDAQFVEL